MSDQTEVRTEALWFDAAGAALPSKEGAAFCEIVELLGDTPLRRTYASLDGGEPAVVAASDAVRASEDWIKTGTWDLWGDHDDEPNYRPIDTRSVLFRTLNWDTLDVAAQRTALMALMELPAWDAAPDKLKGESYEWLRGTGASSETKTLETKRADLRDAAEWKIARWEQALEDVLERFYARKAEQLIARLRGPAARRGTRHWKDEA